jgi:hypothetical protein
LEIVVGQGTVVVLAQIAAAQLEIVSQVEAEL